MPLAYPWRGLGEAISVPLYIYNHHMIMHDIYIYIYIYIFTGLTRRRRAADLGATPSFHRLLSRPVALGNPLGTPWAPLGDPLGTLGDPLGIPGGPLRDPWGPLGTTWGPLGDLPGRLGAPWARLGDPFGTTYQFFWTL